MDLFDLFHNQSIREKREGKKLWEEKNASVSVEVPVGDGQWEEVEGPTIRQTSHPKDWKLLGEGFRDWVLFELIINYQQIVTE